MATTTENTAIPAPVTEITQEDLYNAEPQLVQCTEVLADLRKKRKQKGLSEDRIKKLDAQIKKQLQWRKQLEAEAYEFLGETPPESADTERPKPVKKKAPAVEAPPEPVVMLPAVPEAPPAPPAKRDPEVASKEALGFFTYTDEHGETHNACIIS
jgi:hypothetical protein